MLIPPYSLMRMYYESVSGVSSCSVLVTLNLGLIFMPFVFFVSFVVQHLFNLGHIQLNSWLKAKTAKAMLVVS